MPSFWGTSEFTEVHQSQEEKQTNLSQNFA